MSCRGRVISGWLKTQGMFSGAALRRHCQHMFGCGVEVGERAGTQQPVEVLGQAAITDFGEAEPELDDREDMQDPRPGLALDAVLFAHLGVFV